MKNPLSVILSLALLVTGAVGCSPTQESSAEETTAPAATLTSIAVSYEEDDYYFAWQNSSYQRILLTGSTAAVHGDGLDVQGSTVTISSSGTYEITGTLTDGNIIVDVNEEEDDKTVFLVLNGADIQSQTSAPIYIKGAKKAVLLLEPGTENSVADVSHYLINADGEPSAAIFSKADLTITGSGKLTVTAGYNDGITSKDDLKITDGTLSVTSKADGIVGKDSLSIKDGRFSITAGKDGLRSTNETEDNKGNLVIENGQFSIASANDAIQAAKVLQIDNGHLDLTSGGGYPGKTIRSGNDFGGFPGQKTSDTPAESTEEETSRKGLKAGQGILINGGSITVSSYEDSLHSNNDAVINGGGLSLQSGDDGLHADNNLIINDGEITIGNSYESLEGTNITVNGGKINAVSADDGINVNSNTGILNITGGEISLNANGDGADSNGIITMTGGTVYVDGPASNNNGALDFDSSFTISGGTLAASGSSGMAQVPSTAEQPSILMSYSPSQAAGSTITLKDKDGNIVIAYTPSKQYSSVAMSSPKLSVGSSYSLYSGDTEIVDVTLSESITYLSESGVTAKPQNTGPGGGRKPAAGDMPPREGGMPPNGNRPQ